MLVNPKTKLPTTKQNSLVLILKREWKRHEQILANNIGTMAGPTLQYIYLTRVCHPTAIDQRCNRTKQHVTVLRVGKKLILHLPTFILKSLKECTLISASFFFIAIAKSAIVTIWESVASFSYDKYSKGKPII